MTRFFPFFALTLTAAQPAHAADELCNVIRRMETANFEKSASPNQRRWVEFHWGFDPDSFWSWGCRHSGDAVARQTCKWLQGHTNQEFTMILPQNIMICYGYKFPPHAAYDWAGMVGTITLHGQSNRNITLDLSYRDLPHGESAIRLAIELDGTTNTPEELAPIVPMQTDAASRSHKGS